MCIPVFHHVHISHPKPPVLMCKKTKQQFPWRTPRIVPYGHWQAITFSRALERAGNKKILPDFFISTVWNLMYGVKNIIMYVIRKLPGWRGSYQTWKLVQPLLSWQHGTSWVMLLIFQWSRGGGKYSIICLSVPETVHCSLQYLRSQIQFIHASHANVCSVRHIIHRSDISRKILTTKAWESWQWQYGLLYLKSPLVFRRPIWKIISVLQQARVTAI